MVVFIAGQATADRPTVGGFVLVVEIITSATYRKANNPKTIALGQPIEGKNSQNRGAFFILLVYLLV